MEGTGVLRNDDQRLSKLGEVPTPAYRLASLRLRKSNKTLKLLNYFELFPVPSHTLSDYFMPYTPGPCSSTGGTAQITGDGGSSNSSLLFFHIFSWSTFDCHKSLICRCLQMFVALEHKKSISKISIRRIHLHKKNTYQSLVHMSLSQRRARRLGWHCQSCHTDPYRPVKGNWMEMSG